ncbi:glycosyltransferase [Vibrio breoganii]
MTINKVLVIGHGNPKHIGGVEAFCRSLAKWFDGEVDFTFCAVYKDSNKDLFVINNVVEVLDKENMLHRISHRLSFGLFHRFLVNRKLRNNKYDKVILNSPYFIDLAKKYSQNIILVQHMSVDIWWKKNIHFNSSNKRLSKCKELCHFVALSDFDRSYMIERFDLASAKVKTIRNPSNLPRLIEKKSRGKKLLMLSRLDEQTKRFTLAIDAMKNIPDFELHIYGDGEDKSFISNKIIALDNVFLHNSTSNVVETLDDNSILLCLSENEGYPVSCVEAMYRGLPIICRSTFLSSKDIIDGNGVLLQKEWDEKEFIDAIHYIYANYDSMSEASKELSKRHSDDILKKLWQDLLCEC